MTKISTILNQKLCIGCGLCSSYFGKESVKISLSDNGFFLPIEQYKNFKNRNLKRLCPGITFNGNFLLKTSSYIWGNIESCCAMHSNDPQIRHNSSSGGIISSLAIYLLENHLADGIIHVRGDSDDYQKIGLVISKNRDEILNCASSIYAPIIIFKKIIEILENNEGKFVFIGKPCDISALSNLFNVRPELKMKIKYTISLICAGLPSSKCTENLIDSFFPTRPIKDLRYRGKGWPGHFSFTDTLGKVFKISYKDSWMNFLGKDINYRCKICPDGIGLLADIAVGDAWETKGGYPDFSEKPGESLVIIRSKEMSDIINAAVKEKQINISRKISISNLKNIQPYQYNRRKKIGARLLAHGVAHFRLPNFNNAKIVLNSLTINPIVFLKEFLGTLKRLLLH